MSAQSAGATSHRDLGQALSDEECLTIIKAACIAVSPAGQSEDDLQRVIDWAEGARVDAWCLELVINGEIAATIRDGELYFIRLDDEQRERLRSKSNE